jgi:hypothetical protein
MNLMANPSRDVPDLPELEEGHIETAWREKVEINNCMDLLLV